MGDKYYITNGNKVIGLLNNTADGDKKYIQVVGSLDVAARFKYEEARQYLINNLAGEYTWRMQKFFSSNSGKKYIITTATMFVANGGTTTFDFSSAKPFRSVADADAYIRSHGELVKNFGDCFIVNNRLEQADLSGTTRKFTDEQLDIIGATKATPRIRFTQSAKDNLLNTSDRRCALCGKPLRPDEATVDHIIPISRGGTNKPENLRCVCEACNKLKSDRVDSEMFRGITNMMLLNVYRNPVVNNVSDLLAAFIRAEVRGVVNKTLSK